LPTEASHDSHGSYDSRGTPHSAIPTAPYGCGPAALPIGRRSGRTLPEERRKSATPR
jgi:hypothetical protein